MTTTEGAASPPQHYSQEPEMRGQGVHTQALRIIAFWSEVARTLGRLAQETLGPGEVTHSRMQKFQDAWEESRRTARAEEVKSGVSVDPNTRPLDPSSSSTDPDPKRYHRDRR